ncbi:MAG TPA: hypothetical protein P5277_03155 [Candidatus Paceibacterota bacterium]|nr:hypothetical protein [Candidatus Paceibacterota bacterium]
MVKNNLGVLQTKQLAVLFGAVVFVSLVVSIIGSNVGNVLTGKVTLSNNADGTGTYRIRPEGTYADTWLPYSDGNVYLTSNGAKSGAGFVLRKWLSGSSYQNLMTIDKWGNMNIDGNVTIQGNMNVSGDASSVYLKSCTFAPRSTEAWIICKCPDNRKISGWMGYNCEYNGGSWGCTSTKPRSPSEMMFKHDGNSRAYVWLYCIN